MKNPFKEVVSGFMSLVTGMRITLAQCFKPTITVLYPREALKLPPRFRGHIELVLDPETGKSKCIACKLCERACPSDCIVVDGAKLEGAKRKSVTLYNLDFTKCSLCGSCIEVCPEDAIRFSHDYNVVSLLKEDFHMDLMKKLEQEAAKAGVRSPQAIDPPVSSPSSPPVSGNPPPAVAATQPATRSTPLQEVK